MPALPRKNVFINCPYDATYAGTLRPVIFTVRYLGFTPRLAMESADSGAARIHRILNIIRQSPYAIHDLSRLRARCRGEHFRLNMPFELGLDIGCREFGAAKFRNKKCLILEKDRYSLQAALSDLSNSDVCAHKDEPETAVRHVRNWLVQEAGGSGPGGTKIWCEYNYFQEYLYKRLRQQGFKKSEINTLPLPELLGHMTEWIRRKKSKDARRRL